MNSELFATVDGIIEARSLLKHPFYRAWTAGTLPLETLREYAKQYFHFEAAFPRFLSAVHTRCESPEVRQSILKNLWDEEHGRENHRALWLRFCRALGLSEPEVVASKPFIETRLLIDGFMAACERSVLVGLATLYAYECQAPAIARQKIAGLKQYYGLVDEQALAFFAVHQSLDEDHSQAEREAISSSCLTRRDETAVEEAAGAAAHSLWRFLDGAYAVRPLEN